MNRRSYLMLTLTMAFAASACNSAETAEDPNQPVTITVSGMPTAQANPADRERFVKDIEEFQKLNPHIKVEPNEYRYTVDTFPARLASGQLDTIFAVPFTEPQKLIARGQAADISAYLGESPELSKVNPKLLSVAQKDSKTYGVPYAGYAVGLVYNRELFKKAGLDPAKPPSTWEEVRSAAKRISALGEGVSGYAMVTKDNFGGWFLTMMNASYGNDMQIRNGDKYVSSFANDAGVKALQTIKDLRWTDQAMPTQSLLSLADVQKMMATGKLGMFMGTGDWVKQIVTQYAGDKLHFGMGPLPQGGGNATLTGGGMSMFNPKATPAQIKAALKYAAFKLRRYTDPAATKDYFAAQAADPKAVIGWPELPIFTGGLQDGYLNARKPFVNVPEENFAAYAAALNSLTLKAEPPVEAQATYKMLDGVVQKILTEQGADPKDALMAVAGQVDPLLARAS